MQTRTGGFAKYRSGARDGRRGKLCKTLERKSNPQRGLGNRGRGSCTGRTLQRGVMSTWTPYNWAWNLGKVGRGRQGELCRERVGVPLPSARPRSRPRRVSGQKAQSTMPGALAQGTRFLTSRAQHLEQREVLHAHLLLMPGQVSCGHRGANEPGWSLTLATRPGQPPRDPAPTFGDLQLHRTALIFILVSHGGPVAGARAAGAPGGTGYMAAPAGAGASWCRLRGRAGAGTASRLPAPRGLSQAAGT